MNKTIVQHDEFGNFTGFPDDVLSSITIKGLLGKWVSLKLSDIRYAVLKYHIAYRNIDAGHVNFVRSLFEELEDDLRILTPVLEDLTASYLYGFDDIVKAVYGRDSDEAYLVREYRRLDETKDAWDENTMWRLHAGKDERLFDILTSQKPFPNYQ